MLIYGPGELLALLRELPLLAKMARLFFADQLAVVSSACSKEPSFSWMEWDVEDDGDSTSNELLWERKGNILNYPEG